MVLRRGVVGRITANKSGCKVSILDGVKDFNIDPGIVCLSFVLCPVLSLEVALTFC